MAEENKAPHPVDKYVGMRLRSLRTILGLSQEDIGKKVGITFQQTQKYERGKNRIGSSRLWEFSQILGCSTSYFFDNFENWLENQPEYAEYFQKNIKDSANQRSAFAKGQAYSMHDGIFSGNNGITQKETLGLVKAYYGISDKKTRKCIHSLIVSLDSKKGNENKDNSN